MLVFRKSLPPKGPPGHLCGHPRAMVYYSDPNTFVESGKTLEWGWLTIGGQLLEGVGNDNRGAPIFITNLGFLKPKLRRLVPWQFQTEHYFLQIKKSRLFERRPMTHLHTEVYFVVISNRGLISPKPQNKNRGLIRGVGSRVVGRGVGPDVVKLGENGNGVSKQRL